MVEDIALNNIVDLKTVNDLFGFDVGCGVGDHGSGADDTGVSLKVHGIVALDVLVIKLGRQSLHYIRKEKTCDSPPAVLSPCFSCKVRLEYFVNFSGTFNGITENSTSIVPTKTFPLGRCAK